MRCTAKASGNDFPLHFANHKCGPLWVRLRIVVRIMLRLSILSAVIPLALAGGVAHEWNPASARQCFAAAMTAPAPRAIAFTDDPLTATVKVQIVDRPELADLAIADDIDVTDARDCGTNDMARLFTVSAHPRPGEPIAYLTREADADYRIYIDSAKISARQAAAMIVGARGGHTRLAAHPFDREPTGSISR